MRILKVWDGEYPWDVRAEKVCSALTEAGHEVHMVARNRDGRELKERLSECTVHRISPFRGLGARLDAASQFPAFFNPRWLRLMMRVAREKSIELVLVRDLPLAPTALHVGRRTGVPVVLDMAENYPAMIRDLWTTGSTKPGDFLVRNPKAVEAVERWVLKRVDHTLVVVEESGERLVHDLGVHPDHITVVGNTPSADRVYQHRPGSGGGRRGHSASRPLHLIYLGLLEQARGLAAIIEATGLALADGKPVRLTIIGDGRASKDFRELALTFPGPENDIRFLGYLPYDEALEHFREADVGVIPHLPNESWNTTIPNKLFDYMAAGLAVLTSEAVPTRRVVESVGCGVSFDGGNARSALRAIEGLLELGDLDRLGARGRQAIQEAYNWEQDGARLVDAIERISRSEVRNNSLIRRP
jgi:glycosyltransferase involved in cell wall biosynthesis